MTTGRINQVAFIIDKTYPAGTVPYGRRLSLRGMHVAFPRKITNPNPLEHAEAEEGKSLKE